MKKAPALSRWSLQILMRALTHRPTFPQHRQSTGYGARYRILPDDWPIFGASAIGVGIITVTHCCATSS